MTPPRPDPLDEVLREAHRRGQVVLYHPDTGLIPTRLDDLDVWNAPLDRINARAATKGSS